MLEVLITCQWRVLCQQCCSLTFFALAILFSVWKLSRKLCAYCVGWDTVGVLLSDSEEIWGVWHCMRPLALRVYERKLLY